MKHPAQRLFDQLAGLPTAQRVGFALALKDLADELLTAENPAAAENELTRLAGLEVELRGNPRRVAIICERMGYSRPTYYRRAQRLNDVRSRLKVSLDRVDGETPPA